MSTSAERLTIGISCFPTYGGSGIVATEIGTALARDGHSVHFICYDVPQRMDRREANVFFHEVEPHDYPLFPQAPYSIALASKIVEVASWSGLDLLHVHYAIPHAVSAYLAREIMRGSGRELKLVTTLHGTDITLVGSDPSYLPVTRFAIEQSDAVTVPSSFLQRETARALDLGPPERFTIIPNFVDTDRFAPRPPAPTRTQPNQRPALEQLFSPKSAGGKVALAADTVVLVHVSNFRPVKRVCDVVEVFHRVNREVSARLVLIGDGPDRSAVQQHLRKLGLQRHTVMLGKQRSFVDVLEQSDIFVMPSESESFGLAALEAQSCGVPVVATRVGGVPEVIADGVTGVLTPPRDIEAMTAAVVELARNPVRREEMSRAARQRVLKSFRREPALAAYEKLYREVLG